MNCCLVRIKCFCQIISEETDCKILKSNWVSLCHKQGETFLIRNPFSFALDLNSGLRSSYPSPCFKESWGPGALV